MKRSLAAILTVVLLLCSTTALAGSSLPDAKVGQAYTYQLWSRMAADAVCRLTSGSVPGLKIDSYMGMGMSFEYSGVPTKAGTYYLTFEIDDKNGYTDSVNYQLTVLPAATQLEITTKSLANATVGKSYSAQIKANGTSPIEFGIYYNPGKDNEFGETGLKISTSGKISGTPKKAGSFTFTVYAADASGEEYRIYTLKVNAADTKTTEQPKEDDNTIKKSAKGEQVKLIQTRLTALGYLNDKIDGIFGAKTEQAVKDYQAAVGLTQTGAVDELTYTKLFDPMYVITKEVALTDIKANGFMQRGEYISALNEWRTLSAALSERLLSGEDITPDIALRINTGEKLLLSAFEQLDNAYAEALGLGNAAILNQAMQHRFYCLYLSALLTEPNGGIALFGGE